jgi:hypothetical protein
MWCVQAGTAVSDRLRHDTSNSVNLIEWVSQPGPARQCRVERCDFDDAQQRFVKADDRVLSLAA